MAAEELSPIRKAAIVVSTLGPQGAAAILKRLNEADIERLAREVAILGTVSRDVREQVLHEFHNLTVESGPAGGEGVDDARRLLEASLDKEQSQRITDRVAALFDTRARFAGIERADPVQLARLVTGEHPQAIALILANLKADNAAEILTRLPEDLAADVMIRMADLGDVSPDVIDRISQIVQQRLASLGTGPQTRQGGVRAVAELFNKLDRGLMQATLDRIGEHAPDVATAIRNLMFVFDDLLTVEDTGLREIISRCDKKALTVALKGASPDLRERFFTNMSKRAGEALKEEMEMIGAVRLREVEKAQQEVVEIARKLEEEGVITTGDGGDDAFVE